MGMVSCPKLREDLQGTDTRAERQRHRGPTRQNDMQCQWGIAHATLVSVHLCAATWREWQCSLIVVLASVVLLASDQPVYPLLLVMRATCYNRQQKNMTLEALQFCLTRLEH
jgi:hypothetical protein